MRKAITEMRLLLICVLLLSLSSCKNNLTGPSPDSLPLTVIKGKVDKWSMGDSMAVLACLRRTNASGQMSEFVCGSARVNSDGSFAFNLSEPPNEMLENRAVESGKPDSVKFATVYFLEIRDPNRTATTAALVNATYDIASDSTGDSHIEGYLAYFEYAARDVDMSGTTVWPFGDSGLKLSYDLHYKKGWNRVIVKSVSPEAVQYSVKNINDANWYFVSDRYAGPAINGLKIGCLAGALREGKLFH